MGLVPCERTLKLPGDCEPGHGASAVEVEDHVGVSGQLAGDGEGCRGGNVQGRLIVRKTKTRPPCRSLRRTVPSAELVGADVGGQLA